MRKIVPCCFETVQKVRFEFRLFFLYLPRRDWRYCFGDMPACRLKYLRKVNCNESYPLRAYVRLVW